MTSFSLTAGCALLAFSPSVTLLVLLVYAKAQLVIVVTTSAFADLLSCLLSSLVHLPFSAIGLGSESAFIIIPFAVASRAICRCGFVYLYHKVEKVIEESVHRQELEASTTNSSILPAERQDDAVTLDLSETARLRLEINDVSCALAAGVGFGGMHAIMLYGTLLASESGRIGTLYQPSCTVMPSLVNSAIIANIFSILDIVWMLLTFYGMRKIKGNLGGVNGSPSTSSSPIRPWSLERGRLGGKAALTGVIVSHLAASFSTSANQTLETDGCLVSLPLLAMTFVITLGFFWFFCKENYLPEGQRNRIRCANGHLE